MTSEWASRSGCRKDDMTGPLKDLTGQDGLENQLGAQMSSEF